MLLVQNPDFRIGSHFPLSKELLREGMLFGVNAFQSSFSNNFGGVETYEIQNAKEIRSLFEKEGKYLCIHGCLSINLVGSKDFSDLEKKTLRLKNIISQELDGGVAYGCGVVFHTGSCNDRNKGIQQAIKNIKNILDTPSNHTAVVAKQLQTSSKDVLSRRKFILENSAGSGDCLGNTLEEMEQFITNIDDKRLKICLDTAHLFGAGYDVSNPNVIKDIFSHSMIIDKLEVIHLNDSKVPLGSRKDRHEIIGYGEIWSKSTESLSLLLKLAHEKGIACVCEPPIANIDTWLTTTKVISTTIPNLFYI